MELILFLGCFINKKSISIQLTDLERYTQANIVPLLPDIFR